MRGNFITDRRGKLNPNYKDGRKGTRLYSIYRGMMTRCYNSNTPSYKRYGARGITMCDEWKNDFSKFHNYVITLPNYGEPGYTSIDRIDNNGGYKPGNIRWATSVMQNNNKRNVNKGGD